MEKNEISIYNEDNYLSGDPRIMNIFANNLENLEDIWIIESVMFPELISKYDEFVTKIAEFLRSFGYSSSIECSLIISYLIKNGFLSADQKFEWDSVDSSKELKIRLGCEIVKGEACCRHLSSMHRNIYARLGLPFKELYVYYGSNSFDKAKNAQANHVISLIEQDDVKYGIDIGNNDRLYRFKTPFILREIALDCPNHLRYKPYYELTVGDATNLEEIKKNLQRYCELTRAKTINPFDYEVNYRQKIMRTLSDEEDIFNDFHETTNDLKKEIKELLKCQVYKER